MAIQAFYISIEISEKDKNAIISTTNLKRYKRSDNLIYKDVLYIDNVSANEGWWHINTGLYDFFHSCETLYEFCKVIENIKPNFTFYLLGEKYVFIFQTLLDFVLFIYPKVEKHKKAFEEYYGVLSIIPNKFFSFHRKNKHLFKMGSKTGDGSMS